MAGEKVVPSTAGNILLERVDDVSNATLPGLLSNGSFRATKLGGCKPPRLDDNLWIYCSPFILILGLLGNILIMAVMRRKLLSGTTTSVYMSAMACFDSVALLSGIIPEWMSAICGLPLFRTIHPVTCKIEKFIFYTSSDVAIWILVMFTIDRLIAVCFPFKRRAISKPSRSMIVCGLVCLLGTLKNFHLFWSRGAEYDDVTGLLKSNCGKVKQYQYFESKVRPWLALTLVTFLPFCILITSNCMIIGAFIKVRRQRLDKSRTADKTFIQTAVMCLSVSFAFLVCTLPSIVMLIGKNSWSKGNFAYDVAKSVNNQLALVNHAINFFLYCMTGQKFRSELVAMLKGQKDMTDEDVTLHSYIKWSSQQKQKPNLASALHGVKGHVIRTAMVHKNENDVSDLATETTPLASRYAQDRRDVIEHVVGTALVHSDDCKSTVDVIGDVLENRLNYDVREDVIKTDWTRINGHDVRDNPTETSITFNDDHNVTDDDVIIPFACRNYNDVRENITEIPNPARMENDVISDVIQNLSEQYNDNDGTNKFIKAPFDKQDHDVISVDIGGTLSVADNDHDVTESIIETSSCASGNYDEVTEENQEMIDIFFASGNADDVIDGILESSSSSMDAFDVIDDIINIPFKLSHDGDVSNRVTEIQPIPRNSDDVMKHFDTPKNVSDVTEFTDVTEPRLNFVIANKMIDTFFAPTNDYDITEDVSEIRSVLRNDCDVTELDVIETHSVPGNDCNVPEDLTDTQSVPENDCDVTEDGMETQSVPGNDCDVTEDLTVTQFVSGNDCDVTEDLTDTKSVPGNDYDAHSNLIGDTFSPMDDVTEDMIGTQLLPKNNP